MMAYVELRYLYNLITAQNEGLAVVLYRVIQKEVYTFKNLFYKHTLVAACHR
jgi:hypothetical protein